MTVTIRHAHRADIEAFSGLANKPSVKAICMEKNGAIIGLGGIARVKGRWIGFCDLTDEARHYKMHIARAANRFLHQARQDGVRFIYADRDPDEPRADMWLAHLGFIIDPRSLTFYRWSA